MALVPYRVSGAAADQRASERLLQLPGGVTLRLLQWPALSGASAASASASTTAPASSSSSCCSLPGNATAPGPAAAALTSLATSSAAATAAAAVQPTTPQLHAAAAAAAAANVTVTRVGQSQLRLEDGCGRSRGAAPLVGPKPPLSSLANVGLVVWQAGFLLAEYLLRVAPFAGQRKGDDAASSWRSLTVVDLGTGSGVVGIALALAGARVLLTDLPHVLPLTEANVAANCDPRVCRTTICSYRWGDDPAARVNVAQHSFGSGTDAGADGGGEREPFQSPTLSPLAGIQPDVITAADVLYHQELLPPLMAAVQRLSAPYTVTYVSYRVRHGGEVAAFVRLAEAAGFAASAVRDADLHTEYRGNNGGDGDGDDGSVEDMEVGEDDAGQWVGDGCGAGGGQRPGSYGILRLCRRDCLVAVTEPSTVGS
ncbi:hypothetical protein Agub_g15037 [Astrephomene gubernaculifera]|uniref:Uncharacterized protein n=1 Tax=Astrephomene gubernaculifera TaxID=47775 RepID=A0AAD3E310_9CHLO|nr:hypothetical protein Agub_g15037 [Astrephomene gubernaculifera]